MLSVENVHSGYPLHSVIKGVSLEVADGEIMALVGPNGAGKTTLLRTVIGLIPATHGRIILKGEDITGWRTDRIVRRGLAYVPEGISIFPRMTVEQNLILSFARDERGLPDLLESVFSLFPSLRNHRRHPAEHLSGGEKRMLTIARGIVLKPRLLLLDDPFLGLAPHLVIRLCDFFRDMNRGGVTVLIAGQHVRRILRMASRACLLEEGQVTLMGSGANFLKSHHLHERLIGLKSGGYF